MTLKLRRAAHWISVPTYFVHAFDVDPQHGIDRKAL